jgi:hypothetical protein
MSLLPPFVLHALLILLDLIILITLGEGYKYYRSHSSTNIRNSNIHIFGIIESVYIYFVLTLSCSN